MVVFAGCSTGNQPQESRKPAEVVGAATGPQILNARVGRTLDEGTRKMVAFQKVNDEWRGGFASYDSKVSEFGEIAFLGHPIHPPQGAVRRERMRREPVAAGAEMRLNTVSVRRGTTELSQGAMNILDADGEVVIQRGAVREVVGNSPNGVEQLWEVDEKPEGDGDLVVAVQTVGAPYKGTDARGLVFQAADGTGMVYGQATWIDDTGLRTPVASRWNAELGRVEIVVPHALVESSSYPAALDPILMTANTTASTYGPDTAATGSTNLAVWENYTAGFGNLRFSIIADGTGQPAVSSKSLSTTSEQYEAATAVAGSGFVAVWRDKRSGVFNVRLTRVSTAGATGGEIAVATSASNQYTPDIACATTTNCLVTWNEGAVGSIVIKGSIVNPQTGAASAAFTISGAVAAGVDQYAAAVATNGTNYMVAWETAGGASSDVLGTTVSSAGAPSGTIATIANSASDEYAAAAGYDGTNYYIGYTKFGTDEDAFVQAVTTAGVVSGGAITLASGAGNQGYPNFARNGSTLLAAYGAAGDVAAAPITGGAVGSAFTISSAANGQDSPRLSVGTGNYYAVYNDNTVLANLPTTKATWVARGTRTTSSAAVAPTIDLSTVATPACDVLTMGFSPASPQAVGTAVTVTGTATCTGGATPQYAFYINGGSGYQLVQAYGASNTFNWNTSTYGSNTYTVLVQTRASGSVAAYEAQASASYTLTGGSGTGVCNTLTASASPGSPQPVGTAITVSGAATCTSGATPEYQFYWSGGGVGWTLLQNWSGTASAVWNTTGRAAATYSLLVRTRRQGSAVVYDTQKTVSFTLGGGGGGTDAGGGTTAVCKPLNVSISPSSPQTVGTPVTVTGSATCTNSGTPEYQYYYLPPGGQWTLGRNYGTTAAWVWSTTGKAVGSYSILSRSRAVGSVVTYDDQKTTPYTLQ